MTKITPFTIFLFSLIVIINTFISPSVALISDKRLCYDEKCSEPISLAKTLMKYSSNDKDILSFKANTDVKIFSKGAGKRPDLWGVEIFGKRGYVPKTLIREYKVLQRNLSFEVPTELLEKNIPIEENLQVPEENTTNKSVEKTVETPVVNLNEIPVEPTSSSPNEKSDEKPEESVINSSTKDIKHSVPNPENVSPSYEIVDGTTIHFTSNEPTSKYSSQPLEDTTQDQEGPVLSVHPHPSLVSSTLSFVSKVFDSVAEQFDKSEKENDETIKISDNSKSDIVIEKEQKEIPKEEEVKQEKLKDEVAVKDEITIETDNIKQGESDDLKSEDQVKLEVKKAEDKPQVNKPESDKDVSRKIKVDEEIKDNIEDNKEKQKDEEDKEKNPIEVQIPEQKTQIVNPEELETKSEIESMEISESENYKMDVNNNQIPDVETNSTNVENFSVKQEVVPETVLQEITSVVETTTVEEVTFVEKPTLEKIVTDQVPLPNTQIEENLASKKDIPADIEIIEENKNLKEENVVPEAENLIEINKNVTSEILEQDVLVDQIPEPETVDNSLNATESTNEIKNDVNIVNSDNIVKRENETSTEDSQSSKIENPIQDEINYIEENVIYSQNDVVSNETDIVTSKDENSTLENLEPNFNEEVESHTDPRLLSTEQVSSFNEFPSNRNLLNVDEGSQYESQESQSDKTPIQEMEQFPIPMTPFSEENINNEDKPLKESLFDEQDLGKETKIFLPFTLPPEVCDKEDCPEKNVHQNDDNAVMYAINMGRNYWEFLVYLIITSVTILIFSLGYYYIENARRDSQLIAKINKLEKELMVSTKECILLNENLSCTKTKLNSIEDESFGSNEMVASLKADLEASQNAKLDLEDQVVTLEKELESATEAGLELERMLREFLSSNKEDNPLAQSVENLQARLNAQQAENEALTNALNIRKQEAEGLSSDLLIFTKKNEELEIEVKKLEEELKTQGNMKIYIEQTMEDKVQRLETQMKEMMEERSQLRKELKAKNLEVHHLLEVVDQENTNNVDFEKLYNAAQAKAEALQLAEERDELQLKLRDVEDAHQLLEEHVKFSKEEVILLTEQCKTFDKERKDAETKLEVLSNFFKEKEAQRQKEEAVWLQKQGEVSSTVERIHTMQNEIQNYKQQIEILKREIVEQEREYKSQIGALETKAHEHWVVARQNERRLEELKAESGQLRNRLTLVEKSMNDPDPEVKLHRMETNGETATSPSLFLGADSSSSPIMFNNSSGVPPPPPPSYMFGPLFHPYLPPLPHGPAGLPPFDVGQRPPPLGGRLSSPPPLPLQPPSSGRYENAGSPPPLSPPLPPHYGRHRSPPSPFSNERIHPPLPPPPSLLPIPPLGISHNWGEESLPSLRNSGFLPHQRDQRSRNHKGSLHSSGESLDKSHHSGKV